LSWCATLSTPVDIATSWQTVELTVVCRVIGTALGKKVVWLWLLLWLWLAIIVLLLLRRRRLLLSVLLLRLLRLLHISSFYKDIWCTFVCNSVWG
jgi:hypothetical protein